MDYCSILNCTKEPFSAKPDREFFFQSGLQVECLESVERAIREDKRFNVVIGSEGTGKTILADQLLERLSGHLSFKPYMLSAPDVIDYRQFLLQLAVMFDETIRPPESEDADIKESVKKHLLRQCADVRKTAVLIIDNGHDLPPFCWKILNEFIDLEVKGRPLLVIAIFTSEEIHIVPYKSLAKQIKVCATLGPFNFLEIKSLILFRLIKVGLANRKLFSIPAIWVISRFSEGNPKKIIDFCHLILCTLVIENRSTAGWFMANLCARTLFPERAEKARRARIIFLAGVLVSTTIYVLLINSYPVNHVSREGTLSPTIADKSPFQGQKLAGTTEKSPFPPLPTSSVPPVTLPAATTPKQEKERSSTALVMPKPELSLSWSGLPQEFIDLRRGICPPSLQDLKTNKPASSTRIKPVAGSTTSSPVRQYPPNKGLVPGDPPQLYGSITVFEGETLGDMIRRIYGPYSFNPENTKKVLEVNQHLHNPNWISVGEIIHIPEIPVNVASNSESEWWIQLVCMGQVQYAYRFLRIYSHGAPPMLILPEPTEDGGYKFRIVLEDHFPTEDAARAKMQEFSAERFPCMSLLEGISQSQFVIR